MKISKTARFAPKLIQSRRLPAWFILGWVSFVLGQSPVRAEEKPTYMAIFLDGKKVGHSIRTRQTAGDRVITTEEMNFTVYRAAQITRLYTKETHLESTDGKPLGFEMIQDTGGGLQKRSGVIRPNGQMEVTIEIGGTKQTILLNYPPGALMNEGLQLLQKAKGLAEGVEFEAVVFRPDMLETTGGVLSMTVKGGPKKEIDLLGKKVQAYETSTLLRIPLPFQEQVQTIRTVNYCDENLEPLKILVPFGDKMLELIACEKELALRPEDIFDFLSLMTIACPAALPPAGTASAITYEISILSPDKIHIPSDDNQIVEPLDDKRLLLTVRPVVPPADVPFPYTGTDPTILEALKPTEYLQSNDPKILEMARAAVGSTTDAAKAARQIEAFVKGYIKDQNFSIGYASAREVAESRQGDCSEHAVLTAALCRAVGIPARLVSGLVYVENLAGQKNVFGGHAWAEAYIGGVWTGLDATRAPQGYGPGHIALARGNGNPTDFINLTSVFGSFKIEKVTVLPPLPTTDKKTPDQTPAAPK
ncbi:MAG TPA: transglutaminase-like domain-containing protein [Anaerohalosphaeraceae bacterium]|nr:transglutaminase-like domain-containing protein [Anaerohalosphaeraceae bacterium]HOT73521.1 transglutaminase-like domain-containing protein [Anaerohalosphaeraceae bacterium]HQG06568.1 transglutaminase-like domain-containing protein [Anaerohalosphaeraceae bacterium]HQI08038.1 transglutaminase-like domain-containing protein [Anaerohalosphaeraceae bacterium]HQJ68339.1 transglutaminase-like domain-containing protein [Anaerohalosphaeraceae bacterium]